MQRKGFSDLEQVRGMLAEATSQHGNTEDSSRAGYLDALHQATELYVPDH
jgi:hypothetical protein